MTVASPTVAGPLALGALALVAFGVRSLHRAHPILDLRLYSIPSHAAACVTTAFTSAAMFGAGLLFRCTSSSAVARACWPPGCR